MDELPTKYDVVVIGTGMTGSIVAAAFSRIGKAVLHIDENEYYGEDWASFNLETLETWVARNTSPSEPSTTDPNPLLNPSEKFVAMTRSCLCTEVQQEWNCPKEEEKLEVEKDVGAPEVTVTDGEIIETENSAINTDLEKGHNESKKADAEWTQNKLMKEYRRFNLDISPKMLYSRGPLVELLISSNIARYAEFKSVSKVLTWRENRLEVVPSSRADVFATKHVNVVQKRMLVKVLSVFADYPTSKEEFEGYEEKTFVDYLKHKKFPDQLIHYIVYAIAMGSSTTPCIQGVLACQRFLLSLGRYGNTPFIFPLYGSGELPQCFCRLCAVFGGVYHLNRPVDGFIISEEGKALAIVTGGQRLEANQFVVSSAVCPDQFLSADTCPAVTRAIFITDRSIAQSERENIILLQFPPDKDNKHPVTVFEVGGSCQVCPPGLFLVHMTTENDSIDNVKSALFGVPSEEVPCVRDRPNVLWSLTWKSTRGSQITTPACPPNLKVYCGPDPGLDFDMEVQRAKEIFQELCPDEEFLPRAPDPEEIVMDDPEPAEEPEAKESNEKKVSAADEEVPDDVNKSSKAESTDCIDSSDVPEGEKEKSV